ncbi:aminoacyl-histidine dipeptidase [Algibacillus agarilyticus]|uniref:aminoacyl-histidine dipeptidase n=1 Tax=Algibacillus agarilyticus TaxID=2234133 RepID=UPI000DD02EA8|nr:aminoacyl-histidine dipeptidase [Algibacillus agarilyticus]
MSATLHSVQLNNLYPQPLWQWFNQICAIPHPSKHEAELKAFIQAWADKQGIECIEDKIGNLILRKPATAGMADRKPVVIQAHLDMVPQANRDTQHDFTQDPIRPYLIEETEAGITEQWVTATGTTLGSDNGIGMASALAVLGAEDIAHPALEVLLTVDEEAGMTGAFGLAPGLLNAEILINTDSEQEGEIYMGCAGGVDAEFVFDTQQTPLQSPHDKYTVKLTIAGLKGGHSGCNIELGRANAIKLLAQFCTLYQDELAFDIVSVQGGTLRNAIPRESELVFVLDHCHIKALDKCVEAFKQNIKKTYQFSDPNISISYEEQSNPSAVFAKTAQYKLIAFLQACPNGVMRMSDEIKGVVESSTNMGVLTCNENSVSLLCLIRSLDDIGRLDIQNMHAALAKLANIDAVFSGAYPGWKPDNSSEIMAVVRDVYEDLYQRKPEIMVIHAGLECGLFKAPYPELDMVSIGPTIRYPHSPDEKVNVRTVGLYWQLLLALLSNIPLRDQV